MVLFSGPIIRKVSIDKGDDELLTLGSDDDIVLLHRSTTLAADAELSSVIEGTSDHLGVAANSLIMSNITNDGDIMFAVSDNGNSIGLLKLNGADGTLEVHGDTLFSNGTGVVIGHTAQITANTVAELQVLGSGAVDSSVIIGAFSADTTPAELQFVKSRNASVAGNTIVADNDLVGRLNFLPADGVDFATTAATFHAEVEDGSPAAGDIGMAFVWSTMAGGAASLTEKLRLEADGGLKFNQTSTISTGTGDLTLNPTGTLYGTFVTNTYPGFRLSDSGDLYYEIDTRSAATTYGAYAHRFHTPNQTRTSHATSVYELAEFSAFTLTLTGTTQVESRQQMVNMESMTITDTSSITVDVASTLRLAGAPGAGGSVTITESLALLVDSGNTRMDGALMVGAPSGGMKTAGTINAVAVYDDNSILTDWVFEEYYGKGMELTRS